MTRPLLLDLFCGAGGAAMGECPCPQGLETERAWAAGFFDGEGCISVQHDRRPGRRPRLYLSIEQVDPRPLERFNVAVGFDRPITRRPGRRAPDRQVIHRITMGHASALRTIGILWPWLSEPKREQFQRAVDEIGDDVDPSAVA